MRLVLPLLLLLGVLLTLRLSRRPLRSTTWSLLRSLLPSWRFFEDVEPGPELSFRVAPAGEGYGEWQEALRVRRPTHGLLLNAQGNLRLAEQSLVEQLEMQLDGLERSAAPALVSYRLVQRLIEQRLRERGLARAGGHYQFCLGDHEDGYLSEEHAW